VSSAMNLFPAARLCNNSAPEYAATLAMLTQLLDNMVLLSSSNLILALHRSPENNYSPEAVGHRAVLCCAASVRLCSYAPVLLLSCLLCSCSPVLSYSPVLLWSVLLWLAMLSVLC
jgi:hypothetical protein